MENYSHKDSGLNTIFEPQIAEQRALNDGHSVTKPNNLK